MELELGLALPNAHLIQRRQLDLNGTASSCRKRGFAEADDGGSKTKKKLVGWLPVSCARKTRAAYFVKVKKEGEAIGRKVDLSLHGSYEELLTTLHHMFPICTNHDETKSKGNDHHYRGGSRGVVTYEDGDGDWMLVGDVPWDAFAISVKRLKILAGTN